MGKKSRNKGKEYEQEIARELRSFGFPARRTAQYCGRTEESSDVVGLEGIHIECKRYANKAFDYSWMKQAQRDCGGSIPAVFHRTDNEKTLVTVTLNDFIELYQAYRSALNELTDGESPLHYLEDVNSNDTENLSDV